MLILTPSSVSRPVHSAEVNWQPWSVLKISGIVPLEASAISNASRQRSVPMVLETAQPSTLRECQSITAHR
ncbi:hypothetical protein Hsar01_04126 [Haloferula sargassicola]|uniref:Uncharacterized protein n=1 Tax=Haloferula sargassicola TaxID=490096 RepID=A0ABP9UTW6_9BACT